MPLSLGPYKINLNDKLRSGFRVKYNLLVDKVIKDGQAYASGIKLITHDNTEIEIDILEYFYSKEQIDEMFFIDYATEEEAGKIRIATMEEVLEGEDDLTVVTPYKLFQLLNAQGGRHVIAGEDLVAGDYVYLTLPEEEEDPEEEPDLYPVLIAHKALGTSLKTCVMGFVEEDALEGDESSIKFSCNINTYHTDLIPGQYYFLSDEDPGVLVPRPPSEPGSVQQIVGYAISDLEMRVEIHKPYLNWTNVFIPEFPSLYFEVGKQGSYSLLLTDYLADYNVTANEEEAEEEGEDPEIVTGYTYRFLMLPEWVNLHTVVYDYLTIGGKPSKVGTEYALLEVTDRDKRTFLQEIALYTAPQTKVVFTLRNTSGATPVDVAQIFNGAGFKKPEFDFDIKATISGRHEGWYGKLTTPSDTIPATTDPYDMVSSSDAASYIIGSNIEAEIGFYKIELDVYRNVGEPDNLLRVKQETVKFSFYDEETLAKAKFYLWGAESDTLIGPIRPDGTSAFDVKEAWDVKIVVEDVEHDGGLSVLGSEVGDLDEKEIIIPEVAEEGEYFQFGSVRDEFDPSTYNILLTLYLADELTGDPEVVYLRAISFTINKALPQPTEGVLKLGTVADNTTNFDLISELSATGNSFPLPTDKWTVLNDATSPKFNSDEWFLYRLVGGQLVNVDISIYTGNPQVNTYDSEGITQVESRLFGRLGSKDVGNPSIHTIPSTFRVVNRRRMDGEIVASYQADFSFGPPVPIDDAPIGGPATGTGSIILKNGNGISIIVDDEYNTINVLANPDQFEFDEDPLAAVMNFKEGGVQLIHMDDLAALSVIGNMTGGPATPSAISVITSTTLAGASHINLPSTLAVKTYVDNTLSTVISGTTNFFAKFLTSTTLGVGILSESGISVTANNGIFVSSTADNTNVRGFTIQKSGSTRWQIGKAGLESGSDTGSDFKIWASSDTGAFLGEAMHIERATRLMTLPGTLTIDGSGVVISTTSVTLNPNFNADLLDGQHGAYYLARANHTGTQLAATISDFAAAVRAVPLTGLSIVTGSAITATDTILQAFGKLQGQINTTTGAIGTGTVNFLPYYATATTFGTSPLWINGISLTANQAQFAVDINHNTNVRGLYLQTGGLNRWAIGKAGLEATLDDGSDFTIWAYTDAGTFKGEPLRISRGTMLMTLLGTLTIGGSGVVISTTSTTLNPNFNADLLDGQHGSYYLSRANHTGTQLAATISDFSAAVRAVTLTGLSVVTGSAVVATDTILQAFGKLQGQVNTTTGAIGTGTVGYLPYYNTSTTFANSLVSQSGISVIANGGIFVSDTPTNTNLRGFSIQNGGATRWHLGKLGTESGSDTGSDFAIWAYNDAGSFKGQPLFISRSTLLMTLSGTLTIGGSGVVISTSSTTLNTNFNADLLDSQHGTYYLDRTNHTGVQAISTVTGLQTALDAKTSGSGSVNQIPKFTGTTTFGNSVMYESGGSIFVDGQLFSNVAHNANVRGFNFQASGSNRWSVGKAGTESGSNSGSDYVAWAYNDAGSFLREAFRISRASGDMTLAGAISVTGGNSGQWNTAYGWGNHAGLYAPLSHTHTSSQITDFTSAARGTLSAGTGISYNSSTGVISFSGSTGISGTGSNTYFAIWSGSSSMSYGTVRDTGTEINFGSGRSLGVEGPAAMRDYLHVWGYQSNGTNTNHGTLILHNLSSATINSSAAIEILSSTRGFLNARMTTAQRQAISSPAIGLQVFQTDGGAGGLGLYLHIGGGSWLRLTWDYIGA